MIDSHPGDARVALHASAAAFTEDGGLEEDTGWAEQFLAAFDRVIDER
jgi:hypothetical protein